MCLFTFVARFFFCFPCNSFLLYGVAVLHDFQIKILFRKRETHGKFNLNSHTHSKYIPWRKWLCKCFQNYCQNTINIHEYFAYQIQSNGIIYHISICVCVRAFVRAKLSNSSFIYSALYFECFRSHKLQTHLIDIVPCGILISLAQCTIWIQHDLPSLSFRSSFPMIFDSAFFERVCVRVKCRHEFYR